MIVESLPADEKIERAGAPLRLLDKMPERSTRMVESSLLWLSM
ncbi:hypothetical protein YPPY02_0402 [Yersinia pestis PY-02]|nr:hypothetical protein YPPY02_0402 [Yersinia pestis PY-02]EIR09233.1 hypothetical protein YPPY05_0415 [Yersinia pestis PY-05]